MYRTGMNDTIKILREITHSEIIKAIAIKIATRQSLSVPVALLRLVRRAISALTNGGCGDLITANDAKPNSRSIDDLDSTRLGRQEGIAGDAESGIVIPIAVEVAGRCHADGESRAQDCRRDICE